MSDLQDSSRHSNPKPLCGDVGTYKYPDPDNPRDSGHEVDGGRKTPTWSLPPDRQHSFSDRTTGAVTGTVPPWGAEPVVDILPLRCRGRCPTVVTHLRSSVVGPQSRRVTPLADGSVVGTPWTARVRVSGTERGLRYGDYEEVTDRPPRVVARDGVAGSLGGRPHVGAQTSPEGCSGPPPARGTPTRRPSLPGSTGSGGRSSVGVSGTLLVSTIAGVQGPGGG